LTTVLDPGRAWDSTGLEHWVAACLGFVSVRTLMFRKPSPRLRVLLLEDDPSDADLIAHAVENSVAGSLVRRADSKGAFVGALDEFAPQVILSDHGVADLSALGAFHLTQARSPECPFLLVAGAFDQTASDCLRAGAADFIRKSDLARLRPAIEMALKLRAPLRKLSGRQRQVLQLLAAGCSTREIARELRLSVKTVETHRAQVMVRTGIHDVAGLARYAVEVGIVYTYQGSEKTSWRGPQPGYGNG
jgi:DNA-binding NarL/FixJ family response regulator